MTHQPTVALADELERLRLGAREVALRLLALGPQLDDPIAEFVIDEIAEAVVGVARDARSLSRRTTIEHLRRPAGGCSLSPSVN